MITMHWWQLILGIFGTALGMHYFLSAEEHIASMRRAWNEGMHDEDFPWWWKWTTPGVLVFMTVVMCSWYWVLPFVAFSGILGWQYSASLIAMFALSYMVKKATNKHWQKEPVRK